jgi:hypothetical protein
MNTNTRSWFELAPGEQLALASEKFSRYIDRNHSKCRKWSRRLAHAALTLHPELREEGSLERYFVAKLGRERGYRGVELTAFVDQAYDCGLAKFAIEAGMADGPRQPSGLSQVRDAPEVAAPRGVRSRRDQSCLKGSPAQLGSVEGGIPAILAGRQM